ncbi:hypothetical protein ACI2L1_20880 [Streptomyces sp. NPDC019531]|uniref:hypothetical protein n=1 Tax=Streptomyces sp. NPDC019531 TaxID=3365062 RepID=UPI0038514ADD
MFAELNRAFVADQRTTPGPRRHALAVAAADRLLADLGMKYRTLPCHFRVDAPTHAELASATRLLADAQDKVLAHLCATRSAEELVAMFDVPPDMAQHLDWPTLPASGLRMLRADIVPGADGYWFCELNHFSGVGAGEGHHSARTYAEILGRPVAGVSPFRGLALQYVAECRRAGLTRVVVLDTTEHRRQEFGEHLMLQRYVRLLAPDIELAYHTELTYPERWLKPDEAARTLIHRLFTFQDTTDRGEFLVAVRDSGATVACMFEAELKMHRRWLALLCDPAHRHLLTGQEAAAVDRYVPHTAVLTPEGLDAAVGDKDRLVFKRSYSYGGEGVLLGDRHPPEQLRELLTRDATTWIAQRRIPAPPLDLPLTDGSTAPFHLVLGMYLYGDETAGLLVRGTAASAVVNLSRGGGMSWAFTE